METKINTIIHKFTVNVVINWFVVRDHWQIFTVSVFCFLLCFVWTSLLVVLLLLSYQCTILFPACVSFIFFVEPHWWLLWIELLLVVVHTILCSNKIRKMNKKNWWICSFSRYGYSCGVLCTHYTVYNVWALSMQNVAKCSIGEAIQTIICIHCKRCQLATALPEVYFIAFPLLRFRIF